jgi:hypothetical protein
MTWREYANKVIQDNPNMAEEELKRLISKAYPFGERKYHPYKIWLDCVKKIFDKKTVNEKPLIMFGDKITCQTNIQK